MPRKYDMTKRRAAVESTRRRILEATMGLHARQGILDTSWEDIAAEADVAIGTVYRHFPTLAELVPACGELTLQRLGPPDASRRRELFDGVDRPDERLRRLVAESYAMYERAEDAFLAVRDDRARAELPLVAAAYDVIEGSLDALAAEALEPLAVDATARRVVRAVCDYDTWRALRRQQLTGADAVKAGCRLATVALEEER